MRTLRHAALSLSLLSAGYLLGTLDRADSAIAQQSPTFDHLTLFARVYAEVQNRYVDEVDEERLIHAALRGLVGELDPHSRFLDPTEYANMRNDTRGEYVGVGMEVRADDRGGVSVGTVFEGGPAFAAGLQTGDRLLRIDDEDASEFTTDDVVRRLRGERGARVRVQIERTEEGSDTPEALEIELIRDVIRMNAVTSEMPVPGYGVVRVRSFQANIANDVRSAIDRLQADHGGTLEGLVLDLRDDPGGLLSEAIALSDAFLSDGTIVSTRGRGAQGGDEWSASRSTTRYRGPLVVLVNQNSASASEIVAGALQDNGRAVLVGTRTYGKGSVQSIIELPGGNGLKLTTSLYYTPSGRSIQSEGITPDLWVDAGPLETSGSAPREATLDRALANPTAEGVPAPSFDLSHVTDRQLHTALMQLRAFRIFSQSDGG
jgi:carboxyl-terminal processing protease